MSRVAQAFMTNNKEGMNMVVPLHNFSSFQNHLMTGLFFFFGLRLQTRELRRSPFISRGLIFADFADST